jgi:aminoglycoside phosphotransferase (APT) family kinase protein
MASPTDSAAIARVLADMLPAPIEVTRVESLSGGASAETCAVDVTDGSGRTHELILRRAAGGNAFNPGVGKREEALTQRAAGEAGVAVAKVYAIFDGDEALGSGYIMQRFAGETIPRKLLRDERYATARTRLAQQCGTALAGIHRVPPASLPALPELPAAKQLQQLEAMHRAFGQAVPAFSLAMRWLRERLPPAGDALQLVHGDFRTGNFLVDESGLVAVLDWELVHLGDPLEDLGWLCAPAWRFGGDGAAGGFASREELFAAYEEAGGVHVDTAQVRFWEVFATLRWGVICQFQAFAHLNGMAKSVERAAVGRRVTETELDLLLLIDGKL